MGEVINLNNSNEESIDKKTQFDLVEISDNMLADVRTSVASKNTLSMPIAQIAALGAGVSSLLPAFRTVTQTESFNTQGLYKIANAGVGDALKTAKNGKSWGALKTADGGSKLAQLQSVGPITSTTKTVAAINPATMMMAVALFSIEQKLGKIEEIGKQIISFLEIEKESEIESDIETLMNIIDSYKYNWDNEHFVSSNHKLVLDIKRTARKNMLSYQKKVNEVISSKKSIVAQTMVESVLMDLHKKFQYYRLSLYIYSMASLIEIMLSGNFKEESITTIRDEIEKRSIGYREDYSKCHEYLEKLTCSSIETNVLKGVGLASKAVGKFVENIPVVNNGQADEFLKDSGEKIKNKSKGIESKTIDSFVEISNPETHVFTEKMNDMIQIYNHTEEIYFDENNLYLFAG